jgi:toxin ParE1/3/4
MPARILAAARESLLEMWDYTAAKWGEEQADKYVRGSVNAVERVQSQRHRWRAVSDVTSSGVFFFRHEHHYIFFREFSAVPLALSAFCMR